MSCPFRLVELKCRRLSSQDALSANAKVLMFVNVTPSPLSKSETLCSLNFAARCRAVRLGASRRITSSASSGSLASGASRSGGAASGARTPSRG